MKKIAKLSLVAAIAVSGMTNVNAASLEEAIKGVSISGSARIRYNEADTGIQSNQTDVEVVAKVPVNDMVKVVMKLDHITTTSDTATADNDVTDKLNIEDLYFSYNNAGVTVNVGQQNIPARFNYGKQGDGIVALTNVGGATVGAAYFMNNNATTDENVASILAKGSIAGVALSAQIADVENTVQLSEVVASTTINGYKIEASYNEGDYDAGTKAELTQLEVSGKIGPVSAYLGYGKSGDTNSATNDPLLNGEAGMDNAANFGLWLTHIAERADAELIVAKATLPLTSSVALTAAYATGEEGTTDLEETFGQISYKMSKNFNTYARISKREVGSAELTQGRVELKYSF